jgi:hypothetical protein
MSPKSIPWPSRAPLSIHTDSYRDDLKPTLASPPPGAKREYLLYTGRRFHRNCKPRYVLAGRFRSSLEAAEAAKSYMLRMMWRTYREYEFRGDQEYRRASDGKCVRYYTPMEKWHETLFWAWTVRVEEGAEGVYPPPRPRR